MTSAALGAANVEPHDYPARAEDRDDAVEKMVGRVVFLDQDDGSLPVHGEQILVALVIGTAR